MSTFEITGVRTEKTPDDPHEHITHVKIGSGDAILRRATVIADLRSASGDRYYTYGGGKYGAPVELGVRCRAWSS
jgi:hypothetical protein